MARSIPITKSFTGDATTITVAAPCTLYGFLLGMDGSNDPTITIYDSASATVSGKEKLIPTNTYDSSALGANGALPSQGVTALEGITIDVDLATGALDVTVYYG